MLCFATSCAYGGEMKVIMKSSQNSRALLERAREGDRAAFETLMAQYDPRIRALILSRLAPHLKVEFDDVLQDTLLRGYQSIGDFKWQGEDSFVRWIGGIAEHVIRDLARRRSRAKEVSMGEPAASDVSPSRSLRRHERFDRLQKALAHLTEDHRTVLRMAHIEGFKTRGIAERMDRSPEAVRQLIWRALKQLRSQFDDTESLHLPPRMLSDEGVQDDE